MQDIESTLADTRKELALVRSMLARVYSDACEQAPVDGERYKAIAAMMQIETGRLAERVAKAADRLAFDPSYGMADDLCDTLEITEWDNGQPEVPDSWTTDATSGTIPESFTAVIPVDEWEIKVQAVRDRFDGSNVVYRLQSELMFVGQHHDSLVATL